MRSFISTEELSAEVVSELKTVTIKLKNSLTFSGVPRKGKCSLKSTKQLFVRYWVDNSCRSLLNYYFIIINAWSLNLVFVRSTSIKNSLVTFLSSSACYDSEISKERLFKVIIASLCSTLLRLSLLIMATIFFMTSSFWINCLKSSPKLLITRSVVKRILSANWV